MRELFRVSPAFTEAAARGQVLRLRISLANLIVIDLKMLEETSCI